MLTEDRIGQIAAALKEVVDIIREAIADDIEEPPMGSVVTFKRVWDNRVYYYAAIRTEIGWSLTGKAGSRARTWAELQKFAGDAAILASMTTHTIKPEQGPNDIRARLRRAVPEWTM